MSINAALNALHTLYFHREAVTTAAETRNTKRLLYSLKASIA